MTKKVRRNKDDEKAAERYMERYREMNVAEARERAKHFKKRVKKKK